MTNGSGKRFFQALYARSPVRYYLTLAAITVAVVAVVAVSVVGILQGVLGSDPTDGSDERPPIIVRSGSFIMEGGDPSDDTTIKQHWRDWKQDLIGGQWKPDLSTGRHVNRFDVSVTGVGGCGPYSGKSIEVEYTTSQQTRTFTLDIKPKLAPSGNFLRREPKFDPGDAVMTPSPGDVATSTPPKLEFKEDGYISKLTVDKESCQFAQGQTPRITIKLVHP